MIERIKFKFGSNQRQPNLEFELTPLTVILGPNNSGKSEALREIEDIITNWDSKRGKVIIDDLGVLPMTKEEAEKVIDAFSASSPAGRNGSNDCHLYSFLRNPTEQTSSVHFLKNSLLEGAKSSHMMPGYISNSLLILSTVRLDGNMRLNLLTERLAGNLKEPPLSIVALMFTNDVLRKRIRDITYEAFGKYMVIDPTNVGRLSVRFSDRAPTNEGEEKSWEQHAIKFHSAARNLNEVSDGVKAFTGIISILLAGNPKITLLDESDAFLHPGLSNKLGVEIGNAVRGSNKRVIASTHSASFLMGCIQSGVPLNIVRLTFKNDTPTVRLLSKDKIVHLMRNPLLRSTGVLNGLFYDSVIVTESDTDRAFYQEINQRLLGENDCRGIKNCLFLNAQNKQTIWDIVKPLREMGIPAAGIVDIDFLKDGGQVFAKPLSGAFIPDITQTALISLRTAFLRAFENSGKNMKKDGGIDVLSGNDREAAQTFLENLQKYGVFVVPGGELESWLQNLGIKGHGPNWLIPVFESMKEDPEDANYLKPQTGDVWDFIGSINTWIENPLRKGIPD